jgi:methanogenic corrinoid protein MtbC1
LGTDVPSEAFVERAVSENADIIACSALLTTTMMVMKDVVKEAEAKGIKDKVKIMVGGAPVTQNFCESIGADFYASDAASASDVALAICKA